MKVVNSSPGVRPAPSRRPPPAVDAYSLPFEPVLFVTDPQGVIVERLDSIWDAEELRTALDRAM
jgi:hypothetical protein